MKIETIMNKIQEADFELAFIEPLEEYAFAIDLNNAVQRIGKYSIMYYTRCEEAGLTYKEAQEKLGEHLRRNLGYEPKEQEV